MNSFIDINHDGLFLLFEITEERFVRLLHFSSIPYENSELELKWYNPVEVQVTGENQDDHHGNKHTGTSPGNKLKYKEHRDYINKFGRKLEIIMEFEGLEVISNYQLFSGIKVARCWTEVKNTGNISKGLEYVSSFALNGITKEGVLSWDAKSRIWIPHSTWYGECQWKTYKPTELGMAKINDFSFKRISIGSTGTWSASEYLPMGCSENEEAGTQLFWEIEHNGSWHWEISDKDKQLYLRISGPTENENHWWKNLKPGEYFTSVPVAVGSVYGSFEAAIQELTVYRRIIRRTNHDNEWLPVIFNDYMNCLIGDPTTDKLLPLIDAAAEAGCEYFVIDAGWYSDGYWWDGVGEWIPSLNRFPGGIEIPLNYIKSKDMIPGLWLEIEVIGINSVLADRLPDECFFMRHGKRIIDNGRYQLDFRNPLVIEHATGVIERLVNQYGVGYIKMDYNINAGIGTEVNADSFGDGLLQHNRAYLGWISQIFKEYPELVIENCSSGGMRMDYGMLSLHSIQSTSDQTDYKKNACISAACPTAVTPEQAAVWSYPLKNADKEEVIFNTINAILLRIHQSGHLSELSDEAFNYVKDGISCYKEIRSKIKDGIPFWPIGLPSFSSEFICLGLKCNNVNYLAIWRMASNKNSINLPINFLKGKEVSIKCIYPVKYDCSWSFFMETGNLEVNLPNQYSARLLEIR